MTRVRAIIVEGGQLLTIHRVKRGREYWVFPGGGIEPGETAQGALQRECLEELGVHVRVGDLVCEDDEQGYFRCEITGGELGRGTGEEHWLPFHGVFEPQWLPLAGLGGFELVPSAVRDRVVSRTLAA